MFAAGPFLTAAKSYHGVEVNVISSLVQKSLRRREVDNLKWAVTEWCLFSEWDHPQAKSVLTNMQNRINEIMTVEDILGFVHPQLLSRVDALFAHWDTNGRTVAMGRYIYAAIQMMVQARMCRIGSDIKAQFFPLQPTQPTVSIVEWVDSVFKTGEDQDEDQMWRNCFSLMQVCTPRVIMGALESYTKTKKESIPHVVAFVGLMGKRFIKERKERYLFIIHAVLAIRNRGRNLHTTETSIDGTVMSEEEWEIHVSNHKIDPVIEIPIYVIDMHTSEGRRQKSGRPEFALHGSVVMNEDREYYIQAWRDEYNRIKMLPPPPKAVPAPLLHWEAVKKSAQDRIDNSALSSVSSAHPPPPQVAKKPAMKKRKQKPESSSEDESSSSSDESSSDTDSDSSSSDDEEDRVPLKLPRKKEKKPQPKAKKMMKKKKEDISVLKPLVNYTMTDKKINEIEEKGWVGQESTSKWKPHTYLTGGAVYKGPFKASRGYTVNRLLLTMQRFQYFTQLGIRVPDLKLINSHNEDEWWLLSGQISQVPMSEWKIGELKEMCGDKTGRIVDRESMGLIKGDKVTASDWACHPEAMIEALLALSVRYILDPSCGDSGLQNLIVRTSDWTVWCIDYEEDRSDDPKIGNQWISTLSNKKWPKDRLAVFHTVRRSDALRKRWDAIEDIIAEAAGKIPVKSERMIEVRKVLQIAM